MRYDTSIFRFWSVFSRISRLSNIIFIPFNSTKTRDDSCIPKQGFAHRAVLTAIKKGGRTGWVWDDCGYPCVAANPYDYKYTMAESFRFQVSKGK